MTNSRRKGAAGELELAKEFTRIFGCSARRGQQYSGSPESPDIVIGIPGVHVECKRVEKFELYKALKQSIRDAGGNEVPIVCHRKNREKWVLVVELERFPELARLLLNKEK